VFFWLRNMLRTSRKYTFSPITIAQCYRPPCNWFNLAHRFPKSASGPVKATGAPESGELMPPFRLPDQNGKLVSLEDLSGAGPIVVSFNRGHWCPFGKLPLRSLADAELKFAKHGAGSCRSCRSGGATPGLWRTVSGEWEKPGGKSIRVAGAFRGERRDRWPAQ